MNSPLPDQPTPKARHERLELLLQQDADNGLLLADAAEAALAAGALDRADQLIEMGMRQPDGDSAWRFRLASLRIAQRRLAEARALLLALEAEGGKHPAVTHNLAYVELLAGNFSTCAQMLRPWIDDGIAGAGSQDPALQALWLRAMNHLGLLEEAWDWTQRRIASGTLGAPAAGVASLIAVDLSRMDDALQLSQLALDAGVAQVEPLIARASVALTKREGAAARKLLQAALKLNPNDARTWSCLGFAEMVDQKYGASREAFEKALRVVRSHLESWQGLGWACVLQHELQAAGKAFDEAIALDAMNAESLGGRAVVHALQGATKLAQEYADRALALDSVNKSAQFAQGLLLGEKAGPEALKALATNLLRK